MPSVTLRFLFACLFSISTLVTCTSAMLAQSLPPYSDRSFAPSPGALQPGPEAGANLVQNAGFDTDLGTWNPILSDAVWSSVDANNSPTSGSAVLYARGAGPNEPADLRQCFTGIIPGRQYQWGGEVRFPSGQSTSGYAYMYLVWVSELSGFNNCDGHVRVDPGAVVHSGSTPDSWVPLDGGTVTAPIGAVGAQISFNIQKDQAGGEFRYHADNPYLIDVSAPVLTITGANTGRAGRPLSFEVNAVGGTPGDRSWNWTASGGASIIGGTTRTATFTWPSSGGFSVSVSNSSCGGASTSATVSITTLPASVVLTSPPSGMVQGVKETDSFTLTNLGGTPTNITMVEDTPGGGLPLTPLVHNPETFSLQPGESQAVAVTFGGGLGKSPQALGLELFTFTTPVGAGAPSDLRIPITMLLTSDPNGSVAPHVETRLDAVADPSIVRYDTTVRYTNTGSGLLQGVLVPSATWIDAGSFPSIILDPGESEDRVIHIDRSKRPDAAAPLGSVASDLTLLYLDEFGKARSTSAGSSASLATAVVDTAKPTTSAAGIPPLSSDEVALFLPGVGHVLGSVGLFLSDVSITNTAPSGPINQMRMFYLPVGGTTAQESTVPTIEAGSPLALADVVKQTFSEDSQIGTLQLRTSLPDRISAVATIFNSSNPLGTYGTAIPLFRSDRSAAKNEKIYITGLRKSSSSHSNLFLQEVVGAPISMRIEYRNVAGQLVGTSAESLPAWGLIQRSDVAPDGATSVIITVDDEVEGKLVAFATPVDRASGDTWTITDWRMFYGYGDGEPTVIPIVGSVRGANETHFRTDVAIMNTGASSTSVAVSYYGRAGERVEKNLTLAPNATAELGDVVGGFLAISGDSVGSITVRPAPGGSIAVTSRTFTTAAGQPGTYGTGVPTLGLSASLRPGDVRRIGGLEDATFSTISARRAASFRTNFGLVETAGGSALIRATLRYTASSGSVAAATVQGQQRREGDSGSEPRESVR